MNSSDGPPPEAAVGFDVEHWHQATLVRDEVDDPADHIDESLDIVLDLVERNGVRATFFVVGELAAEHPRLVERIRDAGHELAAHGYTHTPLYGRTPEWFERELSESREAIRDASGVDPIGFRAPNFSITRETAWAFPVLEASGFQYDSSVFPVRTPLYGVPDAPVRPYRIDQQDPFRALERTDAERGLVEVPLSVAGSRVRVPIAGGFYARMAPISLIERGIARSVERGVPANLYFHPWEFNPAVGTAAPRAHRRFISFFGIERLERKVDHLFDRFEFGSVGDVLRGHGLLDPSGDGTPRPGEEVAERRPSL